MHFSLSNAHRPLNAFLAKFDDEEADRAEARAREELRRNKVLEDASEILGKDAVVKLIGVSASGETGKAKKKD